jgi:hypothetical protein
MAQKQPLRFGNTYKTYKLPHPNPPSQGEGISPLSLRERAEGEGKEKL